MIKKFFSSAWPAVVTLCVGVLSFIFGNFFDYLLPEGWLVPLAWVSAVALCLGFILAPVARAINSEDWYEGVWTLCFMWFISIGIILLMASQDVLNKDFYSIKIWDNVADGILVISPIVCGFSFLLYGVRDSVTEGIDDWEDLLGIIFIIFSGILLMSIGLLLGSLWILPIGEEGIRILLRTSVISFIIVGILCIILDVIMLVDYIRSKWF